MSFGFARFSTVAEILPGSGTESEIDRQLWSLCTSRLAFHLCSSPRALSSFVTNHFHLSRFSIALDSVVS